jgi:transposase
MYSYAYTVLLRTSPQEARKLSRCLAAARQLYNACLSEGLNRLQLARQSKEWQKACRAKNKRERARLFREVQKKYKLSDYDMQALAIQFKNACHIGHHIDANTAQKIGTRVYAAISQYMFGKRGRPRFKAKTQFHSVEGKSNVAGIRFKDGKIVWGKLKLKPLFDLKDKRGVEAHALSCKTKYVRLVVKVIRGKRVWFAQLVQAGRPHLRYQAPNAVVGLDIGPSTIAIAADNTASLEAFCPSIKAYEREIRIKQRALDRSRRQNNPKNFNENGTIKAGPKKWVHSNRYRQIQSKISETQRRLAATRKCQQGALANRILRLGNKIQTEKLSYKSFQRNWGKSVGFRAPGMFMEMLRRKALSAGGAVIEFPTNTTRLSQTCHGCAGIKKKKLSERWHECECGVGPVQRDLYCAFLARSVSSNSLDTSQAQRAWPGAKPLLEQAVSRLNQSASGKLRLASFGLSKIQRQSASSVKDGSMLGDVIDVVQVPLGTWRAAKNQVVLPSEPPGFSHGEV